MRKQKAPPAKVYEVTYGGSVLVAAADADSAEEKALEWMNSNLELDEITAVRLVGDSDDGGEDIVR